MDTVKNCPTEDDGSVEYAVGKVRLWACDAAKFRCESQNNFFLKNWAFKKNKKNKIKPKII